MYLLPDIDTIMHNMNQKGYIKLIKIQAGVIMKKMTDEEYSAYAKSRTPRSKTAKNCIKAFIAGGIICTIGEVLLKLYTFFGMSYDTASTLVSVTMIFLGTFLTGLNIYPKLAKHAGAGTLVPVTGFANSVAAPALEAKTEGYITGVGAKIFTIAGPVILFGTLASIVSGLIYYLWKLM